MTTINTPGSDTDDHTVQPPHPQPPTSEILSQTTCTAVHPRPCFSVSTKTILNPVPPIHALPVELIVSIIHHYAQSLDSYPYEYSISYDLRDDDTAPWELPSMKWVVLMLVCQRWRNIGLNTPRLWRLIHITADLDVLKLRLARSAPATIDVFFIPFKSHVEDAMPILLTQAHRIRTISQCRDLRVPAGLYSLLATSESEMLGCMKPLFSCPLPALETVVLLPTGSEGVEQSAPFDLDLTEERHPRIRKLVCSRIQLPSSPTFWSSLRELHLGVRHTLVDDILHILASAPELEVLRLADDGHYVRNPTPRHPMTCASATIVLRHLRMVKMCGLQDPSFVGAILQHILSPVLQRLDLEISVPDDAEVGHLVRQMLLPAARRLISAINQLHITTGGCGVSVHSQESPSCCFRLKIHLQIQTTLNTATAVFGVVCDALQDAPLQYLHFETCCDWDGVPPHMWQSFLTTCTSLRTVKFTYSSLRLIHSMLDVLVTPVEGVPFSRPRNVVIWKPFGIHNSLYTHDLVEHLLDVGHLRASANLKLGVNLGMEHDLQYDPRFWPYHRAPSFKMHRWSLFALKKHCSRRQFHFWDSYHKVDLKALFDEEDLGRIKAERQERTAGDATGNAKTEALPSVIPQTHSSGSSNTAAPEIQYA